MYDQDVAPPRELTQRGTNDQATRPLPRPEAEKPFAAETAINRALGADTTPGAIARSDDAPHIWSEIRQLGHQFARLEKQVEITTYAVEGHKETLQTVRVHTESLCVKHDQFKKDIDTLSGSINNTLNGLIAGSEAKLNGKLESLSSEIKSVATNATSAKATLDALSTGQATADTKIDTLTKGLAAADTTLQALNTTQASTLQTIRVLSPIVKWGMSIIAGLVVAGFGGMTWFWNSMVEPKIVEASAKRAQDLVEENLKNKALQAENEKLKAENEALRKGKQAQ